MSNDTTASASDDPYMRVFGVSSCAPAPSREAAPLDLLAGLPTYDPERDMPGIMELRDKYNDGDYYKVEDVRAAIAQQGASQAPLTKAQIDDIVYQCRQSGNDTTYDIVNAALRAALARAPLPGQPNGETR